jgi:uncharacterized membrane protein
MMSKKMLVSLSAAMIALAGSAQAATTFTYLSPDAYPTGMSADGTAVAGNDVYDFAPYRWTQATGLQLLGMASVPVLGRSAGLPGISSDGTRVASTIHSMDSTVVTAGLWTLGQGWQELPVPPDAGVIDNEIATVWGLSGDGNTVVGLYWRQIQGAPAHAYSWSQATGPVDLGSSGGNSRANGANYDGTVIVGWDAHPEQGVRRAAAWVNGQLSVLGSPAAVGEAHNTNTLGNIAVGHQHDPATNQRSAALWRRNGGAWSATQYLGFLPGSFPNSGLNVAYAASADGNIVVGYCSFSGDPFYTTGFVWTPGGGMQDVVDFLAQRGILPDPAFTIVSLNDITPDGRKILGWGRDTALPQTVRGLMIDLDAGATDVVMPGSEMQIRLLARPNPVRAGTSLEFALPSADQGALSIYDSAGRLVRRVLDGAIPAGAQRVAWDGRDATGARVPAGVYYSRLETNTRQATGKLVVLQ